jgi:hypothetical protein
MKMNVEKVLERKKFEVSSLPCPSCGEVLKVEISKYQLHQYSRGDLVQEVFPNLSEDERERFVSGYCGDCWANLFG